MLKDERWPTDIAGRHFLLMPDARALARCRAGSSVLVEDSPELLESADGSDSKI